MRDHICWIWMERLLKDLSICLWEYQLVFIKMIWTLLLKYVILMQTKVVDTKCKVGCSSCCKSYLFTLSKFLFIVFILDIQFVVRKMVYSCCTNLVQFRETSSSTSKVLKIFLASYFCQHFVAAFSLLITAFYTFCYFQLLSADYERL